jgi:hypothetical protein
MTLSAPKQMTFIISVVLAVVGLLATFIQLGFLSGIAIWLILVGFILLAVGCLVPNL